MTDTLNFDITAVNKSERAFQQARRQLDGVSRSIEAAEREARRFAVAERRSNQVMAQSTRELNRFAAAQRVATSAQMVGSRRLSGAVSMQRRYGMAIQNTAYQVGDFAVQVAAGTSASRAMDMQLPQLLGGFGVLGAVMGAVAAVAVPLAASLLGTANRAKSLQSSVDDLASALDAFRSSVAANSSSVEDMKKKYGDLAQEAGRALKAITAVKQVDAVSSFAKTTEALRSAQAALFAGALPQGLLEQVDKIDVLKKKLSEAADAYTNLAVNGVGARIPGREQQLRQALIAANNELENAKRAEDILSGISKRAGLSLTAMRKLVKAFKEVADASGPEQKVRAMDRLSRSILAAYGGVKKMPDKVRELYQALNKAISKGAEFSALGKLMEKAFDGVGAKADDLVRKMSAINSEFAAAYAISSFGGSRVGGGRGMVTEYNYGQGRGEDHSYATWLKNHPRKTRSSGGKVDRSLSEARRLFQSTRTAAEKYASEVEKINKLHKLFPKIVTDDVVQRGLEQLKEKYLDIGNASKRMARSVSSAIDNMANVIVDRTGTMQDVLSSFLADIAKTQLKIGMTSFLTGALPGLFGAGGLLPLVASANGNVFTHGRVQAFAAGGVVSGPTLFPMRGGTGLMGEAGPEAIMPLTRIGGKLGVRAAGGGVQRVELIIRGEEGPMFRPTIEAVSRDVAVSVTDAGIDTYDRHTLPQRVHDALRNPGVRG